MNKIRQLRYLTKTFRILILGTLLGKVLHHLDPVTLSKKYWSAYGEDAVVVGFLNRYKFLSNEELEFSYIDIGAFEPKKNNNTYLFYTQGKSGTAVEPNPYLKKVWKQVRPRDYYLAVACADETPVNYKLLEIDGESNSTSDKFLKNLSSLKPHKIKQEFQVAALSLDHIIRLHKQQFSGEFILDLDIEGGDLRVIENSQFEFGRPFLALIEDTGSLSNNKGKIEKTLNDLNYSLITLVGITSIYIDNYSKFYKILSQNKII